MTGSGMLAEALLWLSRGGAVKGIYDPGKICPNCSRPPGEGAP